MPPFNADEYFANRNSVNQKVFDVAQASEEKLNVLKSMDVPVAPGNSNTLVGKLGLDPTGIPGTIVNDAASLVTGLGRIAGHAAAVLPALKSAALQTDITQEDRDAYNRQQQGTMTDADAALLDSFRGNQQTVKEQIDAAKAESQKVRSITNAFDMSGLVDQTRRQQLGQELKNSWDTSVDKLKSDNPLDKVAGLANLLYTSGKAVISNPGAVSEYAIENAPQLLMGAFGPLGLTAMVGDNAMYAVDEYHQGLENYRKTHGGQEMPDDMRRDNAFRAATLAAAENAGDIGTLGAGKLLRAGKQAAEAVAKEAEKTTFKNAAKETLAGIGEGALSEGPTEAYQTWQEGQIEGKPASGSDIWSSGVIGAATGSVLAGGPRGAGEFGDATGNALDNLKAKAAQRLEAGKKADATPQLPKVDPEALKTAIDTGNVGTWANTEDASTYAPHHAVAALFGNTQAKPENGEANLTKANEIYSGLNDVIDGIKDSVRTPEEIKQQQADFIAARDAEPADSGNREIYDQLIQGEQDALDNPVAAVEKAKLQRQLDKLTAYKGETEKSLQNLQDLVRPQSAEVSPNDLIDQIGAPPAVVNETTTPEAVAQDATNKTKAAEKLIILTMENPQAVDSSKVKALAQDQSNGLTQPQREILVQFGQAREAYNKLQSLGSVSKTIYNGDKNNRGIRDYLNGMAQAVRRGDQATAGRLVQDASKWAQNQATKAQEVDATPEVHKPHFVAAVKAEAQAIQAMADQLQAGYASQFDKPLVKPTTAKFIKAKAKTKQAALSEKPNSPNSPNSLEPAQTVQVSKTTKNQPTPNVEAAATNEAKRSAVARGEDVRQATGKTNKTAQTEQPKTVETKPEPKAETKPEKVAQPKQETAQATAKEDPKTKEQTTDQPAEQLASDPLGLSKGRESNKALEDQKLNDAFTKLNQAAAWINQHKRTDNPEAVDRPLVKTSNFLRKLFTKQTKVSDFLKGSITPVQQKALQHFLVTTKNWMPKITADFKFRGLKNNKGQQLADDRLYTDPIQDFLRDTGTIPENMATAIAYVAYTWFHDAAGKRYLTNKAILAMFGLKDSGKNRVSIHGRKALNQMTSLQGSAVQSLGAAAVRALGIQVSSKAPQSYLPVLTKALGEHALELLRSEGLVKTIPYKETDLAAWIDGFNPRPDVRKEFVQVIRDEQGGLNTKADGIRTAQKGAHNIIQKLMEGEQPTTEVFDTPQVFRQKKAKKSNQLVPRFLAQTLNKAQQVPNFIDHNGTMKTFASIGKEAVLTAAGWKDTQATFRQVENMHSIETQNENLERQYDQLMATAEAYPDGKPFFLTYSVWKNFRVGIVNAFNPQTSKIHRSASYRPNWRVRIDTSNVALMQNYFAGIAQAFGFKTDRKSFEDVIKDFHAWLADEGNDTVRLITTLRKANQGREPLSEEDKAAIGDLAADKEGMQTLQAMTSYGEYLAALDRGDSNFNTTLLVGVDGKTNGPILTALALGAGKTTTGLQELLHKGGIYFSGDGILNYNDWHSKGGKDLYETIAGLTLGKVDRTNHRFEAIEHILGSLVTPEGEISSKGRTLAKTPVTSLAFGSSIQTSIADMQRTYLQAIFDKIEELANDPNTQDSDVEKLVNSINEGIRSQRDKLPNNLNIEQLLNWSPTKSQVESIYAGFDLVLGKAVKDAINTTFGTFIKRRNAVNQALQLSHAIYAQVRQALRETYINKLMDAGEVAFATGKDGTRTLLRDLTKEQESAFQNEIRDLLPEVNTAYSQEDGSVHSGVYAAKDSTITDTSRAYEYRTLMGKRYKSILGNWSVARSGHGERHQEASPGVGGLPWLIHSLDSFIMHHVLDADPQGLNIHDDNSNSVKAISETARAMNKAMFDALLDYSPLRAASELLDKQVSNLAQMVKDGVVPQQAVFDLTAETEGPLLKALQHIHKQAYLADGFKYTMLQNMVSNDQYTWEGGEYQTTEDDRGQIGPRLTDLRATGPEVPDAVLSAAEQLDGLLREQSGQTVKQAEQQTDEPVYTEEDTATEDVDGAKEAADPATNDPAFTDKTSVFGPLIKGGEQPRIPSNPELVDFFKKNPTVKAGQLKDVLGNIFGDTGNSFGWVLYQRLAQVVGNDVTIHYITPQTLSEDVVGTPQMNSRGWYVHGAPGNQHIYVLSPEFRDSGLTAETLLHELTHAAVTSAMQSKARAVQSHIKVMNKLLEQARKYVADNHLNTFEHALRNADEFVAWGMTNAEFQRAVLAKIPVKKSVYGKLKDGMQLFVRVMADLLGFNTVEQANSLGAFLGHSAALMEHTEVLRQKQIDRAVQAKEQEDTFEKAPQDSTDPITLRMESQEQEVNKALNLEPREIFDALVPGQFAPKVSNEFARHLNDVFDRFDTTLGNALTSLKSKLSGQVVSNPMSAWLKAVNDGHVPLAYEVIASPLHSSSQQDFVAQYVEASMRTALDRPESNVSLPVRQLKKLYQEAYKKLKPESFHQGDWNTATATEKAIAQQKYDFVFKVEMGADGRSHHLERFVALGLANEEFNNLLKFDTDKTRSANQGGQTFLGKLKDAFNRLIDLIADHVSKTQPGQRADLKLEELAERIASIEASKRQSIAQDRMNNWGDKADTQIRKAVESIKGQLVKVAKLDAIQNSKLSLVKGASAAVRTIAGGHTQEFFDAFGRLRDQHFDERTGLMAGLVRELVHPADMLKRLVLLTKRNEAQRKQIITDTAQTVLNAFKDHGQKLTDNEKAAFSAVLLRTGSHALLHGRTMARLEQLVSDIGARTREIQTLEDQLIQKFPAQSGYFIRQAMALGYFKVTGKAMVDVLQMNSHAIASQAGVNGPDRLTASQIKEAGNVIEQLVALNGLKYGPTKAKERVTLLLRRENARTDGNGAEFALRLHESLLRDSLDRLFDGDAMQMMHGYVPEMYNPHTEVQIANAEEGKALRNMGYTLVDTVPLDPRDATGETKAMYVLKDGGLNSYLSGALSLTSMRSKGTKAFQPWSSPTVLSQSRDAQMLSPARARAWEPDEAEQTYMVPILDAQGRISEWRYMMQEDIKDTLLERTNGFEALLGTLAGSVFDKPITKEQNKTVLQALHEQFKDEYATQAERYLAVGGQSSDPELREIWNMLPEDTRKEATKLWGSPRIILRKDAMDAIFGYRKISSADPFRRANEERAKLEQAGLDSSIHSLASVNAFQKILIAAVEGALSMYDQTYKGMTKHDADLSARRAAQLVSRFERGWQEVVRETKDLIVIKTGIVLAANMWSNESMLTLHGVSLKDQIVSQREAWQGAMEWKRNSSELERLKMFRDTGYVQTTEGGMKTINRRITELEDAMNRNPIKTLVDAGLMPTIVDDVSLQDDPYSYKSKLSKKVEGTVDKLPGTAKAALKAIYMTHDQPSYKFLAQTTQLSDFVARYALYKYYTTKATEKLTSEDALLRAADPFIIYDMPLPQKLQWADDNGLILFSKYTLRIQRELFRLFKEKPAKMFSAVALDKFIGLGPIVTDSSMMNRMHYAILRTGAFEYPGSLAQLATVKVAGGLLR